MSYRYIGNKTRLLPDLMSLMGERLAPKATVADLMCGTAGVAEALSLAGFRVVASDIMTFAYLHARVRLTLRRAPRFAALGGYGAALDTLNRLEPVYGCCHREFSPDGQPGEGVAPRKYFTAENASRLDAIMLTIRNWYEERLLAESEYALLRHDLVLAANRVANIAGTYGHFRSKWSPSALASLKLTPTRFTTHIATKHVVTQGRAEAVAKGLSADLCYLDPPYTKRQYAANYHLLETLARCDEPPAIGVSGLRPWRDQYSDFCSKVRVRDSFRTIIEGMDCSRFLVSYSEDGLLARGEMEALLSEFGVVDVIELTGRRFRSQRRAPASPDVTEYVFDLQRS